MKPKEKLKYNVFQNFCFLAKTSWRQEKIFALVPLCREVTRLGLQLTELFITPVILSKIEQQVPLSELLVTIGLFTLVMIVFAGLHGCCRESSERAEGALHMHLFHEQNQKACATSYANTLEKEYRELLSQNYRLSRCTKLYEMGCELLCALAGFVLYLLLLTTKLPLFLLVLAAGIAVLGYVLNLRVSRWRLTHQEEVREYRHRMHYVDNTIMNNEMSKDIRIFGLSDWLMELYNSAFALYRGYVNRRELKYLTAELLNVLLSLLRNAIAYIYLIRPVLSGELTASEFLLLFTAVSGFTQWVTTILNKIAQMQERSQDLCQMRLFLDYPEPFLFEEGKDIPKKDSYTITLEQVTYRYPEAEAPTISNLNFTLHPGEKVAIVGLNGAGKTTLVKLLCGFLDPTEGRVLLNGEDIRQYNRTEYYKLFSAVFQDFSNLSSTIAVNVAQMDENIDYEKVADCIEKAGLTEAVAALPKGVESQYGKAVYDDGIELSGGQTQRLMLARALYKEAPMLILDEPTAALDPLAESDMYQKYNAFSAGRSSIFISHRLASTQFCDRVLFLENGQITEEGTHTGLLKQGGGYARLFEVQARYYQEELKEEVLGGVQ